ncbi:MAG: hypothetical protein E7240_06810 [Lachnospiraceae bacterium]|nr:hypothetical protein [Lachnospiraceae bacterium]
MFEFFLLQLKEVPAYLEVLYEKHLIFIIVTLVLYLFALIFWNKLANFVRWIYALTAIGFMVYAFFKKNWALMIIVVASIIVMLLWRIIGSATRAAKQRKRDRKIERRALEQAAKRRGSWEKKQAYSGTPRPVHQKGQANGAAAAAAGSTGAANRPAHSGMTGALPQSSISQNTLTSMIDDAPKDPMAEIAATKAELSEAALTGRIDTEEIESALKAARENNK